MARNLHKQQVYIGDSKPDEALIVKQAQINANQAGDNEQVAAVPDRMIRVTAINFKVANAVTTQWKSGSDAIGPVETWNNPGAGMSDNWGPYGFFFRTAVGEALNLSLGGAIQVSGWLNYIEE